MKAKDKKEKHWKPTPVVDKIAEIFRLRHDKDVFDVLLEERGLKRERVA